MYMQESKSKIIDLLKKDKRSLKLIKIITEDPSIEISSFSQSKEEVLDVYEIYLSNNMQMGIVTNGLKEVIENIKACNEKKIVLASIAKEGYSPIIVYTNEDYSILFGVIT